MYRGMLRREEGRKEGVLFLRRKTPRIYNRLTFVNTIAQVLHSCGIAVRYKLLSPFPSQDSHNRTQQPGQPHIKPRIKPLLGGGKQAATRLDRRPRSGQPRRLDLAAAHVGGAAREARTRQRSRRLATGAVRRRRRQRQLGGGRLLGAEHFDLVLALEQGKELLLLDRLALDEDLGDLAQVLLVVGE